MPDFDDDKGVGLVLLNTDKGKEIFHSLDMEIRVSALEDAKRFNGGFKEHINPHPKRDIFFNRFKSGETISPIVVKCLIIPFYRRLMCKIKNVIKKIIRLNSK